MSINNSPPILLCQTQEEQESRSDGLHMFLITSLVQKPETMKGTVQRSPPIQHSNPFYLITQFTRLGNGPSDRRYPTCAMWTTVRPADLDIIPLVREERGQSSPGPG